MQTYNYDHSAPTVKVERPFFVVMYHPEDKNSNEELLAMRHRAAIDAEDFGGDMNGRFITRREARAYAQFRADDDATFTVKASAHVVYQWKYRVLTDQPKVKRNVRPVLGWRILYRFEAAPNVSAYNHPSDGATVQVDHAHRFGGDIDANWLFATRAAGRETLARASAGSGAKYKLVPVYE